MGELAGGFVVNNRVSGLLAVTRAFGDATLKPPVISRADITKHNVNDINYAVLASDGLWDVVDNHIVNTLTDDAFNLFQADCTHFSWSLVTLAFDHRHTKDNVTCVVVKF